MSIGTHLYSHHRHFVYIGGGSLRRGGGGVSAILTTDNSRSLFSNTVIQGVMCITPNVTNKVKSPQIARKTDGKKPTTTPLGRPLRGAPQMVGLGENSSSV